MAENDDTLDDILFAAENDEDTQTTSQTYTVLIVDDEEDVHHSTKRALERFTFENIGLKFVSAYSSEEGKKALSENPESAVVLLDVVMESEHAGLDMAEWIRKDLKNDQIRIILRTGQAGAAPEEKVIREYDINDYKDKAELTTTKLFSAVTTALRSFKHIQTIQYQTYAVERLSEMHASILAAQKRSVTLEHYFPEIAQELAIMLRQKEEEQQKLAIIVAKYESIKNVKNQSNMGFRMSEKTLRDPGVVPIVASTGRYQLKEETEWRTLIENKYIWMAKMMMEGQCSVQHGNVYMDYTQTKGVVDYYDNELPVYTVYIEGIETTSFEQRLIKLFLENLQHLLHFRQVSV